MAARCEAGGDSWSWNSEYQRLLSLLRTAKGHTAHVRGCTLKSEICCRYDMREWLDD